MDEKTAVLKSLEPLFKEARERGLWFHCGYQDLWFPPDELEKVQTEEGRFIWGAVNWTLRHPNERKEQLRREAEAAASRLKSFESMVG
jgi:hypothetical protein